MSEVINIAGLVKNREAREDEAAPKAEPKAKAKPATEDVVKTAFPGIGGDLLVKIVSRATMSRNGLMVEFAEKSHREWFDKRLERNPKLAYASKGVTITVTKK